jgi:ATP-dependent Clp protease ATP-binding subunit ClpA
MGNADEAEVFDEEYFRQQLFNVEALTALRSAQAEAFALGESKIDSQLLLLGLMIHPENVAVAVVRALGETPERIQQAIHSLQANKASSIVPPVSVPESTLALFPFDTQAKLACRLAVDEAVRIPSNPRCVGSEHLLLGVIRVGSEPLDAVLKSAGITLERTRRAISSVRGLSPN